MNEERTVFKIREHEQLERLNYLLCFKSKSEIAEILIDTEQENQQLHNKIDKAIELIDVYTDGINLEAFDCLKLMERIREYLKDSDVDD